MKTAMKYLYMAAIALTPLFVACNEDEEATGSSEKAGIEISTLDGKITTLQTATEGNGINIILMGDGYTAADISTGAYDEAMTKAMDALFSIHPMSALRKYFNVYAVQKVSISNSMNGYTALGSITDDAGSTTGYPSINALNNKALLFASTVPGFNEDNTIISVVLNTELGRGVTTYPTNGYKVLACSYTPHMGNIDGDTFRQQIIHETVGHGIGKLADEYEPDGGVYTDGAISDYKYGQSIGWYSNLWIYDSYNYTETTPWTVFLDDARYADEILADPRVWPDDFNDNYYIGADADWMNYIYRASAMSIMRDTYTSGMTFNAPSRRAIYNNVMQIATGTTPTYEEFVAFDLANK